MSMTIASFTPPISPLPSRRTRLGHRCDVTTITTNRQPTTMVLNENIKRRLNTGFGAFSAAVALSLASLPTGVVPPHAASASAPVTQVERVTTSTSTSSSSLATVLVARQSLQDLGDLTTHNNTHPELLTEEEISGISTNEDGEFALSVRLCTACALGVLMGSEMGAATLALGLRSLVVISLTSCLATIYALLPPGAETTFLVQVVPPFASPFVAAGASLIGLGLFATLQPRLSRRRLARRKLITRSIMTSGIVASAAGTGAACAAGQALPAVMFYLIALAICRSVPLPRPRGKKARRQRQRAMARQLATASPRDNMEK